MTIRYKLLLATLVIVSITTFLYLGIGVHVFKQDKTAYVYDNMAALVDALAEETTTGLYNAWLAMRTLGLLADLDNLASLDPRYLRQLLMEQQGILSLGIYEVGATKPVFTVYDHDALSPYGLSDRELEEFMKYDSTDLAYVKEHGAALRLNVLGSRLPTLTKILAIIDGDTVSAVVVAQLDLSRRLATLNRASTYLSYLIDVQGNYLLHPDKSFLLGRKIKNDPDLMQRISSTDSARGVFRYVSSSDDPMLVAYRKLDFSDLIMVAEISETQAFIASDVLILRYSYLAVAILGIALLVGLLFTRQLTRALQALVDATQRISKGDFHGKLPVSGNDEVTTLAQSFNTMTTEIERLLVETADKARMEKELETAQFVQDSFFPPSVLETSKFQLNAYYRPASECGGDWWHCFSIGSKLYLLLGDVTGHGVPAALLTAAAHSCIATLKRVVGEVAEINVSPSWLMRQINSALYCASQGKVKMTFLVIELDLDSGRVVYANAAHPMPFFLRLSQRNDETLTKAQVDALAGRPGPWLGEHPEIEVSEYDLFLDPGDALILYTDGLVERRNDHDEEYGESRLLRALVGQEYFDMSHVVKGLTSHLSDFSGDRPADDDITLISFRLKRACAISKMVS